MLSISLDRPVQKTIVAVTTLMVFPLLLLLSKRSSGWVTEPEKTRKRLDSNDVMSRPRLHVPVVYNTLNLFRTPENIHERITRACKSFKGRPFTLRAFFLPDVLVLSTPQAFEDVLKNQFINFPKGPAVKDLMHELLGDGIFTADGNSWAQQRSLTRGLLRARELRELMTSCITRHTLLLLEVLKRACAKNATVDLFKLFNCFSMQAFVEISCGAQLNCLQATEVPFQTSFDRAHHLISQRFVRPEWLWKTQQWLNVGSEAQLRQDIKVIDITMLNFVQKLLVDQVAGGRSASLLSYFLDSLSNSRHPKEEYFDAVYLRDVALNFLVAGRDTIAQTLSWFFYNVSQNARVETKLRSEIYHKLPELVAGGGCVPTLAQANRLTYLEAALKETLRLYPSVPISVKQAVHDTVLSDGTFIAAKSMVGLPMYAMGRMPYVWGPDADEFKPERWIDPKTNKIISVSAYKFVAFNAGPRMCPGTALAGLELKLVAAALLSRFHIHVERPEDVAVAFSTTLPMKGAMNVSLACV